MDSAEDRKLVEAIAAYDRDRRGIVSAAELRFVLTSITGELQEAIEKAIVLADVEGEGKIHYRKFIQKIRRFEGFHKMVQ